MPRQQHEAQLEKPIAETFSALVAVVGRGRWSAQALLGAPGHPPAPGTRYAQQRGSVLRRGRVVECIRPVSMTLHETLDDAPCRVGLKFRWRLEPAEHGARLRLAVTYELNGAASFRKQHWDTRIRMHCGRMLDALHTRLAEADAERGQEISVSGQKTGSSSITVTNVTSVKGRPTFR